MQKIRLFLVCFLLFIATVSGRNITFNPYADRLFDDAAYELIIRKQCRQTAREYGLSSVHFESNYSICHDSVIALAQTLTEKKFSETEKRVAKQKMKDQMAMQLFEKALSNSIALTLAKNSGLRNALLSKNLNDRILSFQSRISINKQGETDVTETIVIANFNDESGNANNTIKRGITRDFPTRYSTEKGFMSTVPFNLISVSRNGNKENYRQESIVNGYRIYCGRADHFLDEGIHTYVIRYTTAKQIKFHTDRDEFYWNVTGNGWSFSIDKADCEISFPEDAVSYDFNCYTGEQGSKDKKCDAASFKKNTVVFHTLNRLEPYEGLTVSVSVKKGVLMRVTRATEIKHFLLDNKFLATLVLIILLLFLVLYRYWRRVGKDPEAGVIIPEFEPPAKLSPADVGYLYHQGYNDKLFTAALIDLAVRKKLHIEVDREGLLFKSNVYKFSAPENAAAKAHERDYDLYQKYGFDADELFGIEIQRGKYNAGFAGINTRFKSRLDENILTEKSKHKGNGFLSLNRGYIGLGALVMIILSIGSIIYCTTVQPPPQTIVYAITLLMAGFCIQIVFMKIIKAYTAEGRAMADKVLGFKMYLETTEKNILDNLNPPQENIQLFEKYLPYAIAVGVENKWSEKFKHIIEEAMAGGYTPGYYTMGQHSSFGNSSQSFASAFSSGLSSTVSSASTPPSSSGSSGSGGGGSSGGGGGGGGGGGW